MITLYKLLRASYYMRVWSVKKEIFPVAVLLQQYKSRKCLLSLLLVQNNFMGAVAKAPFDPPPPRARASGQFHLTSNRPFSTATYGLSVASPLSYGS